MSSDLEDMERAISFAVTLLKDELGPGGIIVDEPESVKESWNLAIGCLESALKFPMIPLHVWRRSNPED